MKSLDCKAARPPIIFVMGPSGCGKTTAINSCRQTDVWLKLSASAWIKNRFPQIDNETRANYSARLSSEKDLPPDQTVVNYMSKSYSAKEMITELESHTQAGDMFASDFMRICRDMMLRAKQREQTKLSE